MPKKEIEFRKKGEIAKVGLNEPQRICSVLEKDDAEELRSRAFSLNTTVAEIVRTLVHQYLSEEESKSRKKEKQ